MAGGYLSRFQILQPNQARPPKVAHENGHCQVLGRVEVLQDRTQWTSDAVTADVLREAGEANREAWKYQVDLLG